MKQTPWTATTLFVAGILLFLAGCRREPPATALPAPATSPPLATATPTPSPSPAATPTATALPAGEDLLRRSQAALTRRTEFGLEIEHTSFLWPGAPPLTISERRCVRLNPAAKGKPATTAQSLLPGDVVWRRACADAQDPQTCYIQVADRPWFRDVMPDAFPPWPERRGEIIATATVTESVTVGNDGDLHVSWLRAEEGSEEMAVRGESWLEAGTLQPQREVVAWQREGVLVAEEDVVYTNCTATGEVAAARLEPWPPATVTPAPTVAPPPTTPGAREEPVPLPGVLYLPEGEGSFPAAVVLHGSAGGVRYTGGFARRLAERGLVALAFCYFGCPDTPETLENIPLEGVLEAVTYLQNRPDTYGEEIGVVGFSRGAELSLIAGVLDETVGPVVAIMGSPWVFGSWPAGGVGWLYQGQPLPFSAIPVEEIQQPVLLLHGQEDKTWWVGYSYVVAERLAAHDHPYELVVYPYRGHELGITPEDVLNRTALFLREHLQP